MQTTHDVARNARNATTARERFAILDRLARMGCSIGSMQHNRLSYMQALAPLVPAVQTCRLRYTGDFLAHPVGQRAVGYRAMVRAGHDLRETVRSVFA